MTGLRIDPYEKWWMLASGLLLSLFLLAVALSIFYGFALPSHQARVDPSRVSVDPPFANPTVVQRGPGLYSAFMRAQIWTFLPNEIRIPAGSTVTFYLTSPDAVHGFMVERTNINVMVMPGQVSTVTARFDEPGEYRFLCHEYCGLGHQAMSGRVVVERRS